MDRLRSIMTPVVLRVCKKMLILAILKQNINRYRDKRRAVRIKFDYFLYRLYGFVCTIRQSLINWELSRVYFGRWGAF